LRPHSPPERRHPPQSAALSPGIHALSWMTCFAMSERNDFGPDCGAERLD
jgi:hypothetical protein